MYDAQTLFTQVKSQIGRLDSKSKQRILQLLQTSLATPAAGTTPAATPPGKKWTQEEQRAHMIDRMRNE